MSYLHAASNPAQLIHLCMSLLMDRHPAPAVKCRDMAFMMIHVSDMSSVRWCLPLP